MRLVVVVVVDDEHVSFPGCIKGTNRLLAVKLHEPVFSPCFEVKESAMRNSRSPLFPCTMEESMIVGRSTGKVVTTSPILRMLSNDEKSRNLPLKGTAATNLAWVSTDSLLLVSSSVEKRDWEMGMKGREEREEGKRVNRQTKASLSFSGVMG